MENLTGITPDKLKEDGWSETGAIDDGGDSTTLWSKRINGEWYDLYYSGIDEDYTLRKLIGVADNIEDLYKLING